MELLTDASDNIINGCIAYCGGPISAIKACPMQLKDGIKFKVFSLKSLSFFFFLYSPNKSYAEQ